MLIWYGGGGGGRGEKKNQFDSTETGMKSNVCVRFGVGPRGSSAAPAD